MDPSAAIAAFDKALQDLSAVNAARKEQIRMAAEAAQSEEASRELALDWERASDVLRSFSDDKSANLRADIERLVSHALVSVFDEPMEFKLTTRTLRGQQSVEFSLVSNGVERPVLGSHGGGVSQVVAFVLRLVVVMLSPNRHVLILDEPFSQVSAEFRPRLAAFLREIVDATDLQLILVTHDTEIPEVADVHYRLSAASGVARVA